MQADLRNRTLVAAEFAKQGGFDNTFIALIEISKELEAAKASLPSLSELSRT